jgi:hypothetical protein
MDHIIVKDIPAVGLNISGLPDDDALQRIGLLIDALLHARSGTGTDRAFALLDEIQSRALAPDMAALVHYFRANAWESKKPARTGQNVWAWEQPESQAQILELRRAIRHEGFNHLHVLRKCQILTNLANELDQIGRFIEAVEMWDRALRLKEKFAMARGNRGIGLSRYARSLYDGRHARFMLVAADDALTAAMRDDALYESADHQSSRSAFEKERREIAERVDIAAIRSDIDPHRRSLGKNAEEKAYRIWCLANRLFINPLNDLGPLAVAAQDVLTLPSLTDSAVSANPPAIIGFFNQMKQEFVSARYLYYDGVHARGLHFSDRDVLLYNTLNYPAYSLATEKMRAAFRLAYSLFDKIGFFLNDYFSLGHKPRQVSFRSVWYESKGSAPPLLQRFATYQNWPLRGLFWLSKDLFEEDFQLVTEPDAEALNDIRNHLEHKYLQLHQEGPVASTQTLGYALTKEDFAAKTLRLLKLTRAALIYLSLAVRREERMRKNTRGGGPILSIPLDPLRDEWKQ